MSGQNKSTQSDNDSDSSFDVEDFLSGLVFVDSSIDHFLGDIGETECSFNRTGYAKFAAATCEITGKYTLCVAMDSSEDEYGPVVISLDYIIDRAKKLGLVDKNGKSKPLPKPIKNESLKKVSELMYEMNSLVAEAQEIVSGDK